jgi:hypothetical protein
MFINKKVFILKKKQKNVFDYDKNIYFSAELNDF